MTFRSLSPNAVFFALIQNNKQLMQKLATVLRLTKVNNGLMCLLFMNIWITQVWIDQSSSILVLNTWCTIMSHCSTSPGHILNSVLLQINDTLISLVVFIAGKEKKFIGFSFLPNKRIIVWRKERGRTFLCCR